MTRPKRITPQRHSSFWRCPAPLPVVTPNTCRHKIGPSITTAARLWHYMIYSQMLTLITVLTSESISPQNVFAREHDTPVRNANVNSKPHDTRPWKRHSGRPQGMTRQCGHEIGLVEVHQDYGALDAAHGKRTEVLVEYQYVCLHPSRA